MSTGFTPRQGDVASVAVHAVEAEEARRRLDELGWLLVDEQADGDGEGGEEDGEEPESRAAQSPAT
jgi:hypothetical protein